MCSRILGRRLNSIPSHLLNTIVILFSINITPAAMVLLAFQSSFPAGASLLVLVEQMDLGLDAPGEWGLLSV